MSGYLVEFKFYLDPLDAENFCSALSDALVKINTDTMDIMVDQDLPQDKKDSYLEWYKGHEAYMRRIKERVIGSSQAVNEDGSVISVGKDPAESEKHRIREAIKHPEDGEGNS